MQLRIGSTALLAVVLVGPAEAARTEVSVSLAGDLYSVEAVSEADADRDTIWQVLTDYESYPRFVPGLQRSSVIGADPLRKGDVGVPAPGVNTGGAGKTLQQAKLDRGKLDSRERHVDEDERGTHGISRRSQLLSKPRSHRRRQLPASEPSRHDSS